MSSTIRVGQRTYEIAQDIEGVGAQEREITTLSRVWRFHTILTKFDETWCMQLVHELNFARGSRHFDSGASQAISGQSRGDLGLIGGFVVLGVHTQRKKMIFAPFPMDGELHVDDSPLDPAHGSC